MADYNTEQFEKDCKALGVTLSDNIYEKNSKKQFVYNNIDGVGDDVFLMRRLDRPRKH